MYEDWTTEDLKWKISKLQNEIKDLERELREVKDERDHLQWRIKTELEPLLRAKSAAYDAYVTNPERSFS